MRMLIQRVKRASVTIDGDCCGRIGPGLLVLLGVHKDDESSAIPWMVQKLCTLRIFSDEQEKMNLSVKDVNGEVLVVSQFTLYGNCSSGRRPDFLQSAKGEKAVKLYDAFVEAVRQEMGSVQTGRFAAKMEVELINDGPVTLMVDTAN